MIIDEFLTFFFSIDDIFYVQNSKGKNKKKKSGVLLIPFSNSDLRHNDLSRNDRNLHDHNLNNRNGSKRERDEHIERYWQPTLQRE